MSKFVKVSKRFSNEVVVVNTTPHPLTFQSPEGKIVIIPTSVKEGERSGFAVINAKPTEISVGEGLVKTVFEPSEEGKAIIAEIMSEFKNESKLRIVGSLAAANAYKEVVGMVPAPGFERVPPAEKKMSVEKFNVGEVW